MARKSNSPASAPKTPAPPYATTTETPWAGFVNLSIDEKDKEAFTAWREMNADYMDALLSDVVGVGAQLTVKYHAEQQGFSCSLTAKPHPDLDLRCVMSSWGNSPTECIHMALYKWDVLLGRDMSDYFPKTSKFARWG